MKRSFLALCGLALFALAACGGKAAGGDPAPASTSTSSKPAGAPATTRSTAGSTAQVRATVEANGLLFVGATTAKTGDTIKISVTNSTSGPIDVKVLDPAGKTAASTQVAGNGTADVSTLATTAGSWKVMFTGTTIGTGFDEKITVK